MCFLKAKPRRHSSSGCSNTTTTTIVCGRILTYDRRRNIERKVVVDPTDTDGARYYLVAGSW